MGVSGDGEESSAREGASGGARGEPEGGGGATTGGLGKGGALRSRGENATVRFDFAKGAGLLRCKRHHGLVFSVREVVTWIEPLMCVFSVGRVTPSDMDVKPLPSVCFRYGGSVRLGFLFMGSVATGVSQKHYYCRGIKSTVQFVFSRRKSILHFVFC